MKNRFKYEKAIDNIKFNYHGSLYYRILFNTGRYTWIKRYPTFMSFPDLDISVGFFRRLEEEYQKQLKQKETMNKYTPEYCRNNRVEISCRDFDEFSEALTFFGIEYNKYNYLKNQRNIHFLIHSINNDLIYAYNVLPEYRCISYSKEVIPFNNLFNIIKNTKEIIGYKCPTDLYEGAIPKGTVLKNDENSYQYMDYELPKEIVETWEPVYKEEDIKIGDKIVVFSNTNYITIDDISYTYQSLINLRVLMNKGQIKSLNVGCNGQYKVDLELLNKIIDKLDGK